MFRPLRSLRLNTCLSVLQELLREQQTFTEGDPRYIENGDAPLRDAIYIVKKRIEAEPKAV